MCSRRGITLWAGSNFVLLDPDPADQNQWVIGSGSTTPIIKYRTCVVGERLHSVQEAVLSFWIRIQPAKIDQNRWVIGSGSTTRIVKYPTCVVGEGLHSGQEAVWTSPGSQPTHSKGRGRIVQRFFQNDIKYCYP
jgi:hypothetical protein